jgi:hypothetical protein
VAHAFKFEVADLQELRKDLLQAGADYVGAGEIIQAFLTGHGYGVSPQSARSAAIEFAVAGCSLDSIRSALDRAALDA